MVEQGQVVEQDQVVVLGLVVKAGQEVALAGSSKDTKSQDDGRA